MFLCLHDTQYPGRYLSAINIRLYERLAPTRQCILLSCIFLIFNSPPIHYSIKMLLLRYFDLKVTLVLLPVLSAAIYSVVETYLLSMH